MALNLFEERGSELAERLSLKPPNSLSSEMTLIAWRVVCVCECVCVWLDIIKNQAKKRMNYMTVSSVVLIG